MSLCLQSRLSDLMKSLLQNRLHNLMNRHTQTMRKLRQAVFIKQSE